MTSLQINGSVSQKNIIVTGDGKKYEKPKTKETLLACTAGASTGLVTRTYVLQLFAKPVLKMLKTMKNIDQSPFKCCANYALSNSGLAKKGVAIVNAENANQVEKMLFKTKDLEFFKNNFLGKFLYKNPAKAINATVNGQNAFCHPIVNKVFVNNEKFALATFHEMGHALNKNMKGFGQILQHTRAVCRPISAIILLTALLKRKKADGEEAKGFFDKTTTFIKKNAGKLAVLSLLPQLAEEGLASIKANKLAKPLLSADNLKMMNNFNATAWLTYLGITIGTGAAVYAISKVRDAIAQPKEIHE